MRVLNVGGGGLPIPFAYAEWECVVLDIDPRVGPDICMDARDLGTHSDKFDAVYCAHTLEHFYRHDGLKVLRGMKHVLTDDGFVEIIVPNIAALMWRCVANGIGMDDTLYDSAAGPVTAHDVIYGFGKRIEGGNEFYAHKCGYTPRSLGLALQQAGFRHVEITDRTGYIEVGAIAYAEEQKERQCRSM